MTSLDHLDVFMFQESEFFLQFLVGGGRIVCIHRIIFEGGQDGMGEKSINSVCLSFPH